MLIFNRADYVLGNKSGASYRLACIYEPHHTISFRAEKTRVKRGGVTCSRAHGWCLGFKLSQLFLESLAVFRTALGSCWLPIQPPPQSPYSKAQESLTFNWQKTRSSLNTNTLSIRYPIMWVNGINEEKKITVSEKY